MENLSLIVYGLENKPPYEIDKVIRMTTTCQPETAKQTVSNRKKAVLAEARAEALRSNLKKRKEQLNARKDETLKE